MDLSRLSSCTYPVREKPVSEALQIMADAGVTKADLWGSPPHFSLISTQVSLDDLLTQSAATGVAIANLGSYPGRAFASANPAVREAELAALRATLQAASALGSRSIRVLPGLGEDPAMIEQIAPYFAAAAPLAEELGLYMGMENHGGSIAGSPRDVKRLCELVGSKHFGVLYEPANLTHSGVDYKEAFDIFADHIVHIHMKDGTGFGPSFKRSHLGEGEIDYVWVKSAMESIGYTGDYALEYEICDIEPIETGLPRWVAFAAAL
ncbi:MAG: sugar phosphate isomerase/epimerase family protein [Armatimonadota bacterium]